MLARLGLHPGFRSEKAFWEKELTLEGEFAEFVSASLDPDRMERVFPEGVSPYVHNLRQRFGQRLRALDVGCGPASLLSLGHLRGLFDLTGVDPLAKRYRAALARLGKKPVGTMRAGFGERLTELLPPESFHLVYSCNALDHTQSPGRALAQMCSMLAPGGYLYVQGYVREGSANMFHGLHQHDLYLRSNGRLMCRTRSWPFRRGGREQAISDELPLHPQFQTPPSSEVKSPLRVVYRKLDSTLTA
jgi:SAM-dependent methyltransferase